MITTVSYHAYMLLNGIVHSPNISRNLLLAYHSKLIVYEYIKFCSYNSILIEYNSILETIVIRPPYNVYFPVIDRRTVYVFALVMPIARTLKFRSSKVDGRFSVGYFPL